MFSGIFRSVHGHVNHLLDLSFDHVLQILVAPPEATITHVPLGEPPLDVPEVAVREEDTCK